MKTLFTALAAVFFLLAASCTSPLATLKSGTQALPAVGPGETQLVFHLNANTLSRATYYPVSDIKYLVVQLHSQYGHGSKFATAPVSGTSVAVNIGGLVAGPWDILVSAYDWDGVTGPTSPLTSSPDPTLLYTAMDQISIVPGTSTPVNLLLYKPGDVGSVTLTEALVVNQVTLAPNPPLAAIPTSVTAGSPSFQVLAAAWNVITVPTVMASDQTFSWYSDNPDVATVSSSGGNLGTVFPKNPGTTKITVKSRESEKYGTNKFAEFTLTVDPAIVGLWKAYITTPTPGYRYAQIKSTGVGYTIHYLSGLDNATMPSLTITGLATNGASSWLFDTNKRIDLATGTEMTGMMNNYGVNLISNNQIKIQSPATAPTETVTFERVANPVFVTSISLPTGPLKTGQALTSASTAVPSTATVGQLYFSSNNGTVATSPADGKLVNLVSPGSVTVTARSVLDPSKVATQTYTVDSAAMVPGNLNVLLSNVTSTSIVLSWTNNSNDGLTAFDVYKAVGAGTFALVAPNVTVANMVSTNWTDSSLSPGTEYRYHVVAKGGTGTSTSVYVDSVPSPDLSVFTLDTSGNPVIVTGPLFNPGTQSSNRGDGTMIPSVMPSTWSFGAQGFTNAGDFAPTGQWFRLGEHFWMVYSLPLAGAPGDTVIVKWDQKQTQSGSITVTGITKVWSITGPVGNQFTLNGAGGVTRTITWNPPTMDFITP